MIKAIIFDLDDTLIFEKEYVKSGFWVIAENLKNIINQETNNIFNNLIKLFDINPKNVFNRLFEKYNINYNQKDINYLINIYRNHKPNIRYFPDVAPFLKYIKKNKLNCGIITDGYINTQTQKLKILKAINSFNSIIITDKLGVNYRKPHPLSFELMKKKLKVNFNEMIYVGDNPKKDFYISHIYPIITIRIMRKGIYHKSKYYKNIKEYHRINQLNELKRIINMYNKV